MIKKIDNRDRFKKCGNCNHNRYSQDPNLFWDLLKNEISLRYFMKISTRSNSSEDLCWISSENLAKIFRRKDFKKIWNKTFSSKNLQKIFLYQTISSYIILEIYRRSSIKIFLRSTWDLLVFVLIINFEKICQTTKNGQMIF